MSKTFEMANKVTKAEYEGYKKAVANPMTPAPIKQKLQGIIDQYASEYEGKDAEPKKSAGRKPATGKKAPASPKATGGKKSVDDIEKAKAEIKRKTGKTEEECESIIEQYRALRTKAQEGKRKAEQANADNKKRVEKLDNKGDLIEGTNIKTADAVIESTAKDVAEKIEQQIEVVEEKAEKEAKAEVAKDNTIKTPKAKKDAIKEKVDDKVKKETKIVVERVVIDTSALLTSIATSLGKFDKDSQKEFLIKLRSDIDKLLAKYAFGGMTNGATQVMNVQQSNLSASSVNPTMFAKGGGVFAKGRVVLADGKGVGGNKNKTYQLIKFDYTDGSGDEGFEIREMPSNKVMSQGTNYGEVLQYFNLYTGKFANGGGVDKLPANLKKRLDTANKIIVKYNGKPISEAEAIRFNSTDPIPQSGYNGGLKAFKLSNAKGFENATKRDYQTIGDTLIDISRKMSGKDIYADGGVIGQEIVFDDSGEENTGVIKEITNLGDYIVKADDGRTLLAQRDLDVISLGAMRQQGVEQRKKRFGFFEGGGGVSDVDYDDILAVLEEKLTDSVEELPNSFENSYNAKGEEVEHQSRDGFIAFTDGGYEIRWFEYVSGFWGAGYSLPTKALEKELNRQIDLSLEDAKDFFISEYPEIVEELGEDNINYNSLYEAGYESEAEELSEAEMENMDGTIMCEIGAYYYTPNNDRGIEGEHTLRLFGLVNLESPYHRSGNLEDRYDIDITFNSIAELEEIVEIRLKEIIDWFNGSHYFESTEELRIRRMAKGGMTEHGLRVGDRILGESKDLNQVFVKNNDEWKTIDLDKGLRYAKGGKLWIDTKTKGGLKGVKPSRKNSFRNEAVKRGLTSGQLASRVLANPKRYKGINPKSAQLVKNMGVRKHGGSIGDVLRNRRGE